MNSDLLGRFGLAAAVALGCSPLARIPCSGNTCGPGRECLGNRCLAAGSESVPPGSHRLVLFPRLVARVGGSGGSDAPAGTLGSELSRGEALYLGFEPLPAAERIASAFLLLEPATGTEPNREDVPVEVFAIGRPWTPARAEKGARPELVMPRATGVVRSSPRAIARIDVTDVVRRGGGPRYGLAVLAAGTRATGAVVWTGAGRGEPRLELYLTPSQKP